MARPFTKEEVEKIIKEYQDLINRWNNLQTKWNMSFSKELENAVESLKQYNNDCLLENVPSSHLSKFKSGLPIKILEENNYAFVKNIIDYPEGLVEIDGISRATANEILEAKSSFLKTLKSRKNISLSVDSQNNYSNNVLRALYNLIYLLNNKNKCSSYMFDEKENIEISIDALKDSLKKSIWIFVAKDEKAKYANAFEYLKKNKEDGHLDEFIKNMDSLDEGLNKSIADIWKDYSENTVIYAKQLEESYKYSIVNDTELYGLPEDLANKITGQDIKIEGLNCELRRYQEWGVKYALHQERIILGDEMGLGKTIQAIATMVSLSSVSGSDTHFIVVCPASVITNWCREIASKSSLLPIKVHGADKEQKFKEWLDNGGVAVTTYETTDKFQFDDDFKFEMLVVDEAHYIKNPGAQRSKNVRAICEHAQRIMFMTGTALENRVEEMIELISILRPELSTKLKCSSFMFAAPEFRSMIAPVYYRRKREDVLTELPEKIETQEWCELNKDEEKVYEQAILEGKFNLARRVSWNAPDINESCKAKRLLEICDEAKEEGRKIIVFSFFLDTMKTVTELLGDRCVSIINGSVPPQKRQEIIDEFEKAPAGAVLPAQIQAGGTGLNIQSASVVVICEPQYKPSIENQAISRAYRMGQARNVLVYRLLCEDSIDEKIIKLLEDKQEVFNAFADESEAAKENLELDEKTLGDLIQEEIDRIKEKRAQELS